MPCGSCRLRYVTAYELELRETGEPETVLVEVAGELDLTNAHEVEERLGDFAANGSRLVLDLNRVVFIDSAALHVLFRIARRLGRERFGLLLERDAAIARTLEIVGISAVAMLGSSAEELAPSA
jgi:anti-anti-sigma factor